MFKIFVASLFILIVGLYFHFSYGIAPDELKELNDQLFYAIKSCDNKSARRAINKGADVNAKDRESFTPLRWAAFCDNNMFTKFLIKKGAIVDVTDNFGMTPLHWAVYLNNHQCVSTLLTAKAKTNIKDNYGHQPIDIAKSKNHKKIINIIKNNGEK